LDNQIAACLFLSLPFERRFGPLHFNLLQKEEVTNGEKEESTLEMSLSPK
jgi:hypothetical protein